MNYLDDIRIAKPGAPRPSRNLAPYRKARQGGPGQTPAQDEVAAFIAKCLEAGYQPSIEAIRVHMGWKQKSSVKNCLETMAANGKLPKGFEFKVRVW